MDNFRKQVERTLVDIKQELNKESPSSENLETLTNHLNNLSMQNKIKLDDSKRALDKYMENCQDEDMKKEFELILGDTLDYNQQLDKINELNDKLVAEYNEMVDSFVKEVEEVI